MDSNNKLFIQGKISSSEIEELRKELNQQDFEISKATTLGHGENELLKLIFQDFHVICFARDFILSVYLTSILTKFQKVFKSLNNRNKKVDNFIAKCEIKNSNGDIIFLTFTAAPEKFEVLIKQSEITIDLKLIDSPGINNNIYIELDTDNNIKFTKI